MISLAMIAAAGSIPAIPVSITPQITTNRSFRGICVGDDANENFMERILDERMLLKNSLSLDLKDIQGQCSSVHNYAISDKAISNAKLVLECIIDEYIAIPHIAFNAMRQIGLTWDSRTHRVYLAIDENDKLFLTMVSLIKEDDYDFTQRGINELDEILSNIKKVL